MVMEYVNIGDAPNDGAGDVFREAFRKVNNSLGDLNQRTVNVTNSKADRSEVENLDRKVDRNRGYAEGRYAVKADVDNALNTKANTADVNNALGAKADKDSINYASLYDVGVGSVGKIVTSDVLHAAYYAQDRGDFVFEFALPRGYKLFTGTTVLHSNQDGEVYYVFKTSFRRHLLVFVPTNGDARAFMGNIGIADSSTRAVLLKISEPNRVFRLNFLYIGL